MRKKTNVLWLILTGFIVSAFIHAVEAEEANIVPNSSFEELDGSNAVNWEALPANWTIDTKMAHSGKNSLCIKNTDPNSYTHPHCTVVPEPGGHYDISVWVKLEDVKGGSASFMVEFWGENNEYQGGTWNAPSLTGTTGDWRRLIFENRVIPKTKYHRTTLTVFLTKGATGTVWFDDVEMKKVSTPTFETFLLYPNYRGWILPSSKKKAIEMEVGMNPELLKCNLKNLELNAVLRKTSAGAMIVKDSEMVKEQKWSPPPSEKFIASLDISGIPAGEYELLAYLKNSSSGKVIDMDTYKLKKLSNEEFGKLKTYFDENCVFYVDGKPYFPLGWYTCPEYNHGKGYVNYCNPDEISSDGPFNTVIFYGDMWKEFLDDLSAHGLHILGGAQGPSNYGASHCDPTIRGQEEIAIKQNILKFKDHPAIAGWYINDEVPTNDECYPTLISHYNWISETDPDHPTYAVQMNMGDLKQGAFVTDVLGVDPYPIRVQDLTWVCDMTEEAVKAGHGVRPVWTVVQAHPQSAYSPNSKQIPAEKKLADAPTREEVRCMTYLAITSGAKGLFYYSFFDIKSHLPDFPERMKWHKAIASEIASLSPALFSAENLGEAKITCNDKDIRCLLKKRDGKYYFITVNSKKEKKSFKFEIAGINIASVSDYFNANQNITLENNTFSQEYEPYGTRVYILTEKK